MKYSAGKVGKGKSSAGTTGWNTRKGRTPPRVVDSLTDAFESQLILNPTTSESALRNQGKSKSGKAVSKCSCNYHCVTILDCNYRKHYFYSFISL